MNKLKFVGEQIELHCAKWKSTRRLPKCRRDVMDDLRTSVALR